MFFFKKTIKHTVDSVNFATLCIRCLKFNVPTSANILTQKKEQKSLLLKFVIPAEGAALLVSLKYSKRCVHL